MTGRAPTNGRPPTLLEAVIGDDAARRLAERFGGTRLYVPRSPGEHHPITVTIGPEAAKRLASEFGGAAPIDIPMLSCLRQRIIELDGQGMARAKIARAVGRTERRIYQVLEEAREAANSPQGRLF